jgi:hypothetical protein
MFPIEKGLKQGDVLTQFLFSFSFEYAIRRVRVKQDSLKLHGVTGISGSKVMIFISNLGSNPERAPFR